MHILARVGLQLLGVTFFIAGVYGFFQFFISLSKSLPAIVTAGYGVLTLAGFFCAVYCNEKSKKIKAAREAAIAAMSFTGSRFEAGSNNIKLMLFMVLLMPLILLFPIAVFITKIFTPFTVGGSLILLSLAIALGTMFLSYFRSGKPMLVMDSFGIDHGWYGMIRWDRIHGIFLLTTELKHTKQHALILGVSKPGQYLRNTPWLRRLFTSRKTMEADFGSLNIPLIFLNQPPHLVHAAALDLRKRVTPPLLSGWYPDMSPEHVRLTMSGNANMARMDEINTAVMTGAEITPAMENEMIELLKQTQVLATADSSMRLGDIKKATRLMYISLGITLTSFFLWLLYVIFFRN